MKIVVLAGGLSPERDVSLSSGSLIANALMENGHAVMLVDLYVGPQAEACFLKWEMGHLYRYTVPPEEPDLVALKAESGLGDVQVGPGVLALCHEADFVFLALHGAAGENGQIQALLELEGVHFSGTGYTGSLLAMDKDLTKRLLLGAGLPTPEWRLICAGDEPVWGDFPCVVKPCGCGSSVGVTMVEREEALAGALEAAFRYEDRVLVEKRIIGREFSVGILGGMSLPPIEIIPTGGFYDYTGKYQPGEAREVCPAALGAEATAELKRLALAVHHTLRLGSYSRIDFMMDEVGGFWVLEANTLPGMTPTSLLPQEAAAVGIPYRELCEMIVKLG